MYNDYGNRRPEKPKPLIPHQSNSPAPPPKREEPLIGRVLKDTGKYLWDTVIRTSLLKLLDSIIVGAKDKVLWNGNQPTVTPTQTNYTSYSNFSALASTTTKRRKYDQVPIPSRDAAIAILNDMHNRIVQYGSVSVADVYIMENEPTYWSDNNWGWYSMKGADARQIPGGCWNLVLPDPEVLK